MNIQDIERFWSKVNKTSTCWIWNGWKICSGYGYFDLDGKKIRAHRFAYQLLNGKMDSKLVVDHKCKNRLCVNPFHLQEITNKENVLSGIGISAQNARKTHCKRGHHLSGENLRIDCNGARICKICVRTNEKHRKFLKKLEWVTQ